MTNNLFSAYCRTMGLPEPVTEYRFGAIASGGPGKGLRSRLKGTGLQDWRMDYAWPDQKVALEVEGGVWTGGRHTRGKGYTEDLRKYSEAAILGWRVIRTTPNELCKLRTLDMVRRALRNARNAESESRSTDTTETNRDLREDPKGVGHAGPNK